jgi:spore coat polysaccharide biosynthesis protein SpsF
MKRKISIITQARYGSKRFEGKVLKKICNQTMLDLHLSRLRRSQEATHFVLATTQEHQSKEMADIAKKNNFSVFHGSTENVLERFYRAALEVQAEIVIRVTSDCPLNDGVLIDQLITQFKKENVDYLSNINPPTYPDGMDIEVFTFASLEKAWREASDIKDLEHVTPFIRNNPTKFSYSNFYYSHDLSNIRLTVDTENDLIVIQKLVEKIGTSASWLDYANYLQCHKELLELNQNSKRNEGY